MATEEGLAYEREQRERHERAGRWVLTSYARKYGGSLEAEGGIETVAGDLIADVLHYARKLDVDSSTLLDQALFHFDAEVAEWRLTGRSRRRRYRHR